VGSGIISTSSLLSIKVDDCLIKNCVYRFLNTDSNIIYVGRTSNIAERMRQHFCYGGHLSNECYGRTNKIEYIECNSHNEACILEIYLISKYKPKWNKSFNNDSDLSNSILHINEPDNWKTFNMKLLSYTHCYECCSFRDFETDTEFDNACYFDDTWKSYITEDDLLFIARHGS
jgi:predicted GIY-YIG superfamily endonuclease